MANPVAATKFAQEVVGAVGNAVDDITGSMNLGGSNGTDAGGGMDDMGGGGLVGGGDIDADADGGSTPADATNSSQTDCVDGLDSQGEDCSMKGVGPPPPPKVDLSKVGRYVSLVQTVAGAVTPSTPRIPGYEDAMLGAADGLFTAVAVSREVARRAEMVEREATRRRLQRIRKDLQAEASFVGQARAAGRRLLGWFRDPLPAAPRQLQLADASDAASNASSEALTPFAPPPPATPPALPPVEPATEEDSLGEELLNAVTNVRQRAMQQIGVNEPLHIQTDNVDMWIGVNYTQSFVQCEAQYGVTQVVYPSPPIAPQPGAPPTPFAPPPPSPPPVPPARPPLWPGEIYPGCTHAPLCDGWRVACPDECKLGCWLCIRNGPTKLCVPESVQGSDWAQREREGMRGRRLEGASESEIAGAAQDPPHLHSASTPPPPTLHPHPDSRCSPRPQQVASLGRRRRYRAHDRHLNRRGEAPQRGGPRPSARGGRGHRVCIADQIQERARRGQDARGTEGHPRTAKLALGPASCLSS
jgi:hypothetical protein